MELTEPQVSINDESIPADWRIARLGEVVDFLDGKRKPLKETERSKIKGTIPYYGASGIIDYVNQYLFDDELILLGEDGENILSRNLPLAFMVSGKIWVNNHAHVLKPKNDYDIKYVTQKLESINYEQFNTGTAQPKLNQKVCSGIPLALPRTKAEQTAIATALSDTDALITGLEKLIEKKRRIKMGVVQELLKPKEGWTVRVIGDEIDLLTGFPFPSNGYVNNGIRLLRGSNVKRGVTDWENDNTQYWRKLTPELRPYLLRDGDIVIAMDGSLVGRSFARISYSDLPALLLQRVARIRSSTIDMAYLKETICSDAFTKHCDSVKTSSAIPHISPDDIRSFVIPIPADKNEQSLIALTLGNLSSDINSLEIKLEKCKKVKTGMMQVLLTGKIRLV